MSLSQHRPSAGPLPPETGAGSGGQRRAGPFCAGGGSSPGREASWPPPAPPGPAPPPVAPAGEEGKSGACFLLLLVEADQGRGSEWERLGGSQDRGTPPLHPLHHMLSDGPTLRTGENFKNEMKIF